MEEINQKTKELDFKKLDLESKELELERKKLELDLERKKLDLDRKKLDLDRKKLDLNRKKLDLNRKKYLNSIDVKKFKEIEETPQLRRRVSVQRHRVQDMSTMSAIEWEAIKRANLY